MLLFLDIDGVMVPAKGWKAPELLDDGFPAFSSHATNTLKKLISDKVTIMLTTSHKSNFSIEKWKTIFKNRGIIIKELATLPKNISNLSRKEEIMNWFKINPITEDFIIIDDDQSLNELPEFYKGNLIQTSPYIGLTENHLKAINKDLQSA